MHFLLVSNSPLWVDLISTYLKGNFPSITVQKAVDLAAVEELNNIENIDLGLVDIRLSDKEASDVTRFILNVENGPEVFLFSPLKDVDLLKDSLKYRIHSYILDENPISNLTHCIEEFLDGKKTLGRKSRKEVKQWVSKNESLISSISLSKREREILRMICEEKTSTEISNDLFISEHTVLTHRKNLLKKVGCKNTVGLVHYAYQNDII